MSTVHMRIPASAFSAIPPRNPNLKSVPKRVDTPPPPPTPPHKHMPEEDIFIPRGAPNVSIPRLREALHSLDSKMAFLLSQRHELESHLEHAVRMQSPVLRLPSELLSSIFALGVLHMGDENPVMVATLMLVCRYWSDVALNTPELWTKIAIGPQDSLDKARRKLERSKSCPLDITIKYGPRIEYPTGVTEQVTRAMDLIKPSLWRTRSLSLSVPNRPQAHAALLRCQQDALCLESLSIQVHHAMQDDHYSSPSLPLFNGQTPRLRSCSLTSFNFGWDLRLVSHLRVLKLGGYFNSSTPSPNTIIAILQNCPELEEFALRNMSDVDTECLPPLNEFDPPVSKTVRLPRLKKASFYYSGNTATRQIMSQVSIPNLESLEMCYLENITPLLQLLYTQALTFLPLRFLRIESCLFSEAKFMNLLRRIPSLTRLELVDVEDVSSNFFKCLSSPQPWVCPRLDGLVLDGCTALHWDALRSMVESRLPANPHAYRRTAETPNLHAPPTGTIQSTASAAAAAYVRPKPTSTSASASASASASISAPKSGGGGGGGSHPLLPGPQRLGAIDVTRCTQISKEMVQWLRMYVADVKCEPAKGVWGERL